MTDDELQKSIVDIQTRILEFKKTRDGSVLDSLESDGVGYLHLFTFIVNPELFVEFSHADKEQFNEYLHAIMNFVSNYHIQYDNSNKANLS